MNYGLLFTLIAGLFIVLGACIIILTKFNKKIEEFSIGVAFSMMIGITFIDLIPEQYDIFKGQFKTFYLILLIIFCMLVGYGILKLLDHFVPDHHDHKDGHHLLHVGIVSTIALFIHNIIEGMVLYSSTNISMKTGLLLMVGIGLHNIPMGMVIATAFKNKKKRLISLILLSLSSFLGGFIFFLFKDVNICLQGILLGVTAGMLVYISFMELLPMILKNKKEKTIQGGIILGVLLLLISICL